METNVERLESESPKSNDSFDLVLDDVTKYEWESTLTTSEHPICSDYHTLLFQKADELAKAGDNRGRLVFRFLGSVASLALREDEEGQGPFFPYVVMHDRRSMALEDLAATELDLIAGLLPVTHNVAFRARFADILWVTRKDHKTAKIAAECYLENFKKLDAAKDWVWDIESLRRGFELARALGKKNEPFPNYVAYVEGIISSRAAIEREALSARLMELLLEHESGPNDKHAKFAEQIAQNIETDGNFFLAEQYLDLARKFHLAAENAEGAREAQLKKGESLVRKARAVLNNPAQGYSTGSHFLAMGIECLRQAQASSATIEALHKELRDWQQHALTEMQTFSHATEIGDVIEASRNYVRGKNLQDAVIAFALGHPFIKLAELRETVLENAKKYPLSHLMTATFLSRDGRVLAHKPPILTFTKDPDEVAIDAEMISHARQINWPFRVSAYIEPCRYQINEEHRPSARDLAFLVEHNPFIPPGHEALFLRGLHAGLRGDMMLCAHMLVPQLEEALRYVLRRSGLITSKLDSELVQQERLLGTILAMPETAKIFGEDCVFELRGVFCEKFGFDLRNRLAHGFLTADECFGPDVFVAWWLILRLCTIPVHQVLQRRREEASPDKEAPDLPKS